jgi:hypothetical protein
MYNYTYNFYSGVKTPPHVFVRETTLGQHVKVRTSVIRPHLNKVRNGPKGILLITSLDGVWFLSYFCIGTNTSNSYIWGYISTPDVQFYI